MKMILCAVPLLAGTLASAQSDPVGHDCVLWLKADQSVAVDAQNRVTSITDLSGAGHNATAPVNAGPVLVQNAVGGVGGVGGKPAMRFAGGQWLNLAGQLLTSQQFTIIAVVSDTRTDGGFHEVLSNWDWSNAGTSVFLGTTALNPVGADTTRVRLTDDVGGANQGQSGVGTITNRSHHFILTGISRAGNAEVYQNRILIAGRSTAITPRNMTTPWVIGRQGPIAEFWTGDIAEILVYNDDLTACELGAVYDHLNSRYGLAPCAPVITMQPQSALICPGGAVVFSTETDVGVCAGAASYRWTFNGQPLADGGPYSGTGTRTLTISAATSATVGTYTCEVSNVCGTTPTDPVTVGLCAADYNCDAFIDFFDYDDFVTAFELGFPRADFNGDGFIDFFDYDDFVTAYEVGCEP